MDVRIVGREPHRRFELLDGRSADPRRGGPCRAGSARWRERGTLSGSTAAPPSPRPPCPRDREPSPACSAPSTSSGCDASPARSAVGSVRQLSLPQVDEVRGAVRFGDGRLHFDRTVERLDRRVVVALRRVRLAEDDVDLRHVGVLVENPGKDHLGFLGAIALNERQPVGVLQRRIGRRRGSSRSRSAAFA